MPLKKKEKVAEEVEVGMREIPLEEVENAIDITAVKLHKALDKKANLEADIASLELTLDLLNRELNK